MPFRDVRGHRPIIARLAGAVARGTLPPSLLFAGPEGVGKRRTAVALAQALNCLARKQGALPSDACGECAACRRIARGVHADVLLVEPGETGSIKIEDVRDAIERTAFRPFEGRARVVIVDAADALGHEAQNALLKTLEEPPPASIFVLVTARPDALLPTVRSRCQRLRFGRLDAREIAQALGEAHGYSEADARAAASIAEGSLGRALEGASSGVVQARSTAADALKLAAATTDPVRRLAVARALIGSGSDRDQLAQRLQALASLLRDLGVLSTRADERWLANADLKRGLQALLPSFDSHRAVRAFSAVDRALTALERNAGPKIVADWLALEL